MRSFTMTFYRDSRKEWRWRLKSPNGRIVAESGEGYKRLGGAVNGANSFLFAMGSNQTIKAQVAR